MIAVCWGGCFWRNMYKLDEQCYLAELQLFLAVQQKKLKRFAFPENLLSPIVCKCRLTEAKRTQFFRKSFSSCDYILSCHKD